MKIKFMTLKGGALQAAEGTMISTKEQRIVVGNKSLVKRELGIKFLIKRELGQVLG